MSYVKTVLHVQLCPVQYLLEVVCHKFTIKYNKLIYLDGFKAILNVSDKK